MRSFFLSALGLSVLAVTSTAALAADLPSRRAPPVFVPPPIPVFTWTGIFVGGNAGADFGVQRGSNNYYFPAGSIAGSTGSAGLLSTYGASNGNSIGFTGGGQVGYNYEFGGPGFDSFGGPGGGIVIGIVADGQYLDQHNANNTNYTFAPNTPLTVGNAFVKVPGLARTTLVTNQTNNDFFGTVRGRLGLAFNRALVYGTGGFAYSTRATGYTLGGGFEYALTDNISVGAEYLYVDLSRGLNTTATYVPGAGLAAGTLFLNNTGGRDDFSVARAVVNYKFNVPPPPVPVVARY